MTVPAAGDFEVDTDYRGHISIGCPECSWEADLAYCPTIRDLIAAASAHARAAHPVSVPTATVTT